MLRQALCFAERYAERGVLAAAVLWLAVMVGGYGLRSPNRIEHDGRVVGPPELAAIMQAASEDLEAAMRGAHSSTPPVPAYRATLARGHAAGILGPWPGSGPALPAALPRSADFGVAIPALGRADAGRDVAPVTPLAPAELAATTGRSMVLRPADAQPGDDRDAQALSWVSVGADFDAEAQRTALIAAGYPPFRAHVLIAQVELQRQQRLTGGAYCSWQAVEPAAALRPRTPPEPIWDAGSGTARNQAGLDAYADWLRESQPACQRPLFHEVVAGDEWRAPAAGDDRPLVWAHDDAVQPGHTYRYRLRVKLFNSYVGRMKLVKDVAQARCSVLVGAWSAPSAPVAVRPDSYFFVRGGRPDAGLARIEVWKWHAGDWLRQRFEVGVGDLIGAPRVVKQGTAGDEPVDFSTSALVLDVACDQPLTKRIPLLRSGPFFYQQASTTVLAYVDPIDGAVRQRSAASDRYDPVWRALRKP